MACIQYVFDSAELIRLIAQTSNRILAMYKNMAFHLKYKNNSIITLKMPINDKMSNFGKTYRYVFVDGLLDGSFLYTLFRSQDIHMHVP